MSFQRYTARHFGRLLTGLVVFSLASRLLLLLLVGPVAQADSAAYLRISENLLHRGALVEQDEFTGEWRPHTLRTPGYSLYGALFYALFGIGPGAHLAIAISQILMVTAIVAAAGLLGGKLLSPAIGVVAAALAAVDPWLSYAAINLLGESLFAFFYVAAFWAGVVAIQRAETRWAVLWGILLALCTYVRPIAQHHLVIPVVLFALAPFPAKTRWRLAAMSVLGFGLLIGPWYARNRLATGHWDLATHKGRSLLWETAHLTGPSTDSERRRDPLLARARDLIAATPERIEEWVATHPEEDLPHEGQFAYTLLRTELGLSERSADRLMARVALENVRARPLAYVRRALTSSLLFLTRVSMPVSLAWDLGLVQTGVTESLRSGAYLYPALNLSFRVITAVAFLPLLSVGLWRAWVDRHASRPLVLYLAMALAYHLLVVTLVAAYDRYRVPLHGVLWIFVATALLWILDRRRRGRKAAIEMTTRAAPRLW